MIKFSHLVKCYSILVCVFVNTVISYMWNILHVKGYQIVVPYY